MIFALHIAFAQCLLINFIGKGYTFINPIHFLFYFLGFIQ